MAKVKTKEKILLTSLNIISKDGIDGLNVTSIAKELGVTKSLVLYHFPSNDKIIEELFKRLSEVGRAYTLKAMEDADNFEEQLISIVTGAYSWIVNHPEYGEFFALMYHLSNKHDAFFKVHLNTLQLGLERIELLIFKNDICTKAEVTQLALSIHNLVIGFCLRTISTKHHESVEVCLDSLTYSLSKLTQRKIKKPTLLERLEVSF